MPDFHYQDAVLIRVHLGAKSGVFFWKPFGAQTIEMGLRVLGGVKSHAQRN